MIELCPCCNMPLLKIGAAASGRIEGHYFVMLICHGCALRHKRLPGGAHARWLDAAERRVCAHPERYAWKPVASDFEARMLVNLSGDRATAREAVQMILEAL